MQPKDPDKFEIRFDDTPPEPIDPEEVERHRYDRLRSRVTLVIVSLALLLGVLLAVGYFDLKRRMAAVDTSGSSQVQKVSQTLESSFSSVSVQVAKLEEKVDKRLDSIEKALGTVTRRMDTLDQDIKRLETQKADQKALSAAVGKREAGLNAVREKLDAALAEMAVGRKDQQAVISSAMDRAEDAAARVDNLKTEIDALEAEVETLSGLRSKMEVVDLARKTDREALEKQLGTTAGELNGRIDNLSRRLTELSRKFAAQSAKPLVTPAPSGEAPPASAPSPTPPADSGTIIEQDLK